MQRYLLRRLLLMVPTLIGVSFVVFVIVRAVPGDIVDLISGDFGAADPAVKEAIRKDFGLEGNIVSQYVRWLGDIVQLDMGKSLISGRTVTSELSNRMPVTFQLGIMAICFSLLIAVPIGIISAIRQDTWADYAGRSFAIGLLAAPGFWIAILLISMAGRYFKWGVPPATYIEFTDNPIGNIKLMLMPAIILGGGLSGSV
ncbi:MAG: ABC transporter permease, partial [Dehalococcoidia bacterium]|nr:ABC transporter permease [Dehalococcoidia bacterium]